nr:MULTISPECIES: hypothetical protein [unclassified Mesorhizobium]
MWMAERLKAYRSARSGEWGTGVRGRAEGRNSCRLDGRYCAATGARSRLRPVRSVSGVASHFVVTWTSGEERA